MKCELILSFLLTAPIAVWAQQPPPAPVTIDQARRDTYFAALWVSGTVVSQHDARIAAETDGRIIWVADVGSRIAAGGVMARIDDGDLQLTLSDTQARLESLRAQQR